MMNNFLFYNPVKVYFGRDYIETSLATTVAEYGKKVLLVYGGESILKNGIYGTVRELLDGFELFELSGVESNPDISSVRKGAEICREKQVDVILAVGGGSVIDASKWISEASCVEFDAWDFFSKKTAVDEVLPLVTILTIAATGSEMNNGGVISNRELCKKVGRSSPLLYPKVSFINPEYTFSVNKYQTACGTVDILSHIMEVYFNKQEEMCLLSGIMESMMRTVIKYGMIAFDHPTDYEARANLIWAASWAINGFINGPVRQAWNCHVIEHELSARYGITHGHGLAILLPRWLEYCYTDDVREKYEIFAEKVLEVDSSGNVSKKVSDKLSDFFFDRFGLNSRLRDLGVLQSDLSDISFLLCSDGPVSGFAELDKEDIFEILSMCY